MKRLLLITSLLPLLCFASAVPSDFEFRPVRAEVIDKVPGDSMTVQILQSQSRLAKPGDVWRVDDVDYLQTGTAFNARIAESSSMGVNGVVLYTLWRPVSMEVNGAMVDISIGRCGAAAKSRWNKPASRVLTVSPFNNPAFGCGNKS
jgi:hypothetical protein